MSSMLDIATVRRRHQRVRATALPGDPRLRAVPPGFNPRCGYGAAGPFNLAYSAAVSAITNRSKIVSATKPNDSPLTYKW